MVVFLDYFVMILLCTFYLILSSGLFFSLFSFFFFKQLYQNLRNSTKIPEIVKDCLDKINGEKTNFWKRN
uniref:Bm18 n=1 Tax=Brugia malayi TaxID=6279 RepID=A0A1I9FZK8_BRUMA|nr:Bm18 [Brugia malayi]